MPLGVYVGSKLGHAGASWAMLGHLGGMLGLCWPILERLEANLDEKCPKVLQKAPKINL